MNNTSAPKLQIPFLNEGLLSDYQQLGLTLKQHGVALNIDKINWNAFSFSPFVQLFAAYSENRLWLYYEVKGDFFRSKAVSDQDPVWQDSCVEFFMSTELEKFDNQHAANEIVYNNFEFNALGLCLAAKGTKSRRQSLSHDDMLAILRYPGLLNTDLPKEGDIFDWELCVAIPLNLLALQAGSSFRANFYKCGDKTAKPHYLSWNSIISPKPDFHLPQYFGELELVRN